MPYRRRYRRRRAYRSGYRKPTSKSQDVQINLSKLWRQIKYVKGLVNVEKKFHESTFTTAASSTGTVHAICNIAQGDTQNTRSGNSIYARHLRISAALWNNASATDGTLVRCVVVKDKQQGSDSDPVWTDVFGGSTVYDNLNLANLGRFQIMYDKVHKLDTDGGNEKKLVKINLPMRHHVRYNGANSTDIQKGGLYFMYISDQATNTANFNGKARLAYVDN